MKTAGIPETASTSVVGVKESHVDTANTAAIVNGDNGNKYTRNTTLNVTVVNNIIHPNKRAGDRGRRPELVKADGFHKVSGLKNSRVRRDSGSTSLQVEYTKSVTHTERRQFENEVATAREARSEAAHQKTLGVEYPDDSQNIGILIRDDHFSAPQLLGVEMRVPVASKEIGATKLLGGGDGDSDGDSDGEDGYVFVDMPETKPAESNDAISKAEVTEGNGPERSAGVNYYERGADVRVDDDILETDSADISLRQYVKDCVDGKCSPFPIDVVPSDTGWTNDNPVQSTSLVSETAEAGKLRLEEDTDSYQSEHTLGRGQTSFSMAGQQSQNTKGRRNSTVNKLVDELQRIDCPLSYKIIKRLVENVLFVLRHNPMKVVDLSRMVDDMMYSAVKQNASRLPSEIKRLDTPNGDKVIAEELTDGLWEIGIEHVRHEAEQLIESLLCLGAHNPCELREIARFVNELKLQHLKC